MAKTKNTKGGAGMSKGKMAAIGAGVAALGAGAYYMMGPEGKKHQKQAKVLMDKIKKEVIREAKKVKDVTLPVYNTAVDSISNNYSRQYKAHEGEIKAFAEKLKDDWKKIGNKPSMKSAKKVVSKLKSKVSPTKSKSKQKSNSKK